MDEKNGKKKPEMDEMHLPWTKYTSKESSAGAADPLVGRKTKQRAAVD